MSREFEDDPQVTQTPETNRLLENLEQDTRAILEKKQELGLLAKEKLAARAQEFAALGYFYRIPTTDFSWDHEPDNNNEDSGKLGLIVYQEKDSESGVTQSGVVMTSDGVLWKGYANDGLYGGTFSFDFENAQEVPLEDYLRYFDEAVEVMKYITNEDTGVHTAEFRRKQAEIREKYKQKIALDNEQYGIEGVGFAGDAESIEKATDYMQRIAEMRKMVGEGNRGITPGQLENILGHLFAALEFLDNESHIGRSVAGAQELFLRAGTLISSKDALIGRNLYALTTDMWKSGSTLSSYLVRRANRVPYRQNQENEMIYDIMAGCLTKRLQNGEIYGSIPKLEQPPVEIETDKYGTILSGEIIDWLLNKPVEDPPK